MITFEEFKQKINNRQLILMRCKIEGSSHRGRVFKAGEKFGPVVQTLAYALWKQDNGERWEVTDMNIDPEEIKALNQHFEKSAELEKGEPKKIKKIK